jgi:hypothetical protein
MESDPDGRERTDVDTQDNFDPERGFVSLPGVFHVFWPSPEPAARKKSDMVAEGKKRM